MDLETRQRWFFFFLASTYKIQDDFYSSYENLLSRENPIIPLFGIVGPPLRWWFFLGSFCRKNSSIRKTFSNGRPLLTRKVSLVSFMGSGLNYPLIYLLLDLTFRVSYMIFRWLKIQMALPSELWSFWDFSFFRWQGYIYGRFFHDFDM